MFNCGSSFQGLLNFHFPTHILGKQCWSIPAHPPWAWTELSDRLWMLSEGSLAPPLGCRLHAMQSVGSNTKSRQCHWALRTVSLTAYWLSHPLCPWQTGDPGRADRALSISIAQWRVTWIHWKTLPWAPWRPVVSSWQHLPILCYTA